MKSGLTQFNIYKKTPSRMFFDIELCKTTLFSNYIYR